MTFEDLVERAVAGDERAIATVISLVVDGDRSAPQLLGDLYRRGGTAHVVGVTGAPGAGKSTLVSQIVAQMSSDRPETRVGVIAVDPSSPFSGGAILGDRIRMGEHAGNPNVFIRSVANRGHLGGIASSTPAVSAVLDGVGFDEILIETVGVGQAEVEVATASETTVVVVNPGWGDAIQTAKAGFLEIADVFVVNKADRPETDRTVADLISMLDVGPETDWRPPIVSTVATLGTGTEELLSAIRDHRSHLAGTRAGAARKQMIARHSLLGALRQSIDNVVEHAGTDAVERLTSRVSDPWSEAAAILRAE